MKKNVFWMLAIAMALTGCNGTKQQAEEVINNEDTNSATSVNNADGLFNYETAVDLSDVIATYEKQNASEDEEWSEPEGWSDGMGYELFKDTSFTVKLPQYKDSKHPFLQRVEDFYNSCALAHNLRSNVEMIYRDLASEENVMKSIRKIGVGFIQNKELRGRAQVLEDSLVIVLQQLKNEGDDEDVEEGEAEDNYLDLIFTFTEDIEKHVVYQFFENEEAFSDSLSSLGKQMLKMTEKRFQAYQKSDKDKRTKVMLEQLNKCETFDEQCSLFLSWANCQESADDDDWIVMVATRLMQSGKYNPMLFNVWLDWRSLTQGMLGASRDSEIPNQMYNQMRKKCYLTCLKRIEAYPQDMLAMNCAAVLAGRTNILRIGHFMFGNDGIIEMHELMPKRFEGMEE